jgi:hypothetical protein
MMGSRSDTSFVLRKYQVYFVEMNPGQRTDTISDPAMPTTGHYRVHLTSDRTYYAILKAGRCTIETQELFVRADTTDSVYIKNFYLDYWEGAEKEWLTRDKECYPEQ